MSYTNKAGFISSFLISMPCISFSCLITLTRTSSTMLKSNGEREHPCLAPDLQEKVPSASILLEHYLPNLTLHERTSSPQPVRVPERKADPQLWGLNNWEQRVVPALGPGCASSWDDRWWKIRVHPRKSGRTYALLSSGPESTVTSEHNIPTPVHPTKSWLLTYVERRTGHSRNKQAEPQSGTIPSF